MLRSAKARFVWVVQHEKGRLDLQALLGFSDSSVVVMAPQSWSGPRVASGSSGRAPIRKVCQLQSWLSKERLMRLCISTHAIDSVLV